MLPSTFHLHGLADEDTSSAGSYTRAPYLHATHAYAVLLGDDAPYLNALLMRCAIHNSHLKVTLCSNKIIGSRAVVLLDTCILTGSGTHISVTG